MGFVLTQQVIRTKIKLTSNERLILISIADRIDTKGYSFQSVGGMSRQLNISRQCIHRVLKNLEANGLLNINRHVGSTNYYSIVETALKRGGNLNVGCNTELHPPVKVCDTPSNTKLHPLYQRVTLIDKLIDKGKDNGNKAGLNPLFSFLPETIIGEAIKQKNGQCYSTMLKAVMNTALKKTMNNMVTEIVDGKSDIVPIGLLNNDFVDLGGGKTGHGLIDTTAAPHIHIKLNAVNNMNTLDSIQSAIDGTGLKQKKNPTPQGVWRKSVAEWKVEQGYVNWSLNLTKVDKGKLSTAAKKIGSRFNEVVPKVVEHWNAFVKSTNKMTGNDWVPEHPSINYFIKHLNEATMFDPSKTPKSDTKFNNEHLLD